MRSVQPPPADGFGRWMRVERARRGLGLGRLAELAQVPEEQLRRAEAGWPLRQRSSRDRVRAVFAERPPALAAVPEPPAGRDAAPARPHASPTEPPAVPAAAPAGPAGPPACCTAFPADLAVESVLRAPRRVAAVPVLAPDLLSGLDGLVAATAAALEAPRAHLGLLHAEHQVSVVPRYLDQRRTVPVIGGLTLAAGRTVLLADLAAEPGLERSVPVLEGYRSFAGTAVRLDGQPVGVLCVVDLIPRAWTARHAALLEQLARLAEPLLRLAAVGTQQAATAGTRAERPADAPASAPVRP